MHTSPRPDARRAPRPTDADLARRWLRSRLEWEMLLDRLRAPASGERERRPAQPRNAAA